LPEEILITCTLCERVFYFKQFHEGFAADSCQCGNISILLKETSDAKHNRYKHILAITYSKERPVITDTYTEEK
jgi:hypothetical protein